MRREAHGRRGRRIAALASALLLASGALVGAATLTGTVLAASTPAHADLDDFEIESFHADYTLGRDAEGRSTLHTREHIVAVFPDFDQNRGLIRDIPRVYDGHETDVRVLSVTDETGAARDFTTERYGDFLSVTMAVPKGSYVHGAQHYVIEYTQRDVTRYFADTGADEFYWDLNGTDWTQPFGRISATLTLEDGLAAQLNGDASCYRGAFGSTETCEIVAADRGFAVDERDLLPRENITIAVGFAPGTFAPAPTPPETPAQFLARVPVLLWGGLAGIAATVVTFVTALIRGRGARTGRAIIAQYEPPAGVSVALASEMLRTRKKTMTASLLDLAVRRKIRLLHDPTSDYYGAQAVENSGLDALELLLYGRIFGGSSNGTGVELRTTHWFSPTSMRLGDTAADLVQRARTEAKKLGLQKQASTGAVAAVILLPILSLLLLIGHTVFIGGAGWFIALVVIGVNVLIWLCIGMVAMLSATRRPTPMGALLLDDLRGLREYIRLAEADRIRMLQSASGAIVDEQRIVQVYERLLPYAVLFGFEQEWQAELARYYRESTPDWLAGQGDFTRALPLSSFGHRIASAPMTRATSSGSGSGSGGSFSSFSGGSSGGGFSGGGGGGGGGRGV